MFQATPYIIHASHLSIEVGKHKSNMCVIQCFGTELDHMKELDERKPTSLCILRHLKAVASTSNVLHSASR